MAIIGSTRRAASGWRRTWIALCALVLPAAPARAEIIGDAAPIVQHYADATGGRDALAAEHTIHVKGRIEAIGLSGRWEMWTMAPDRWMRRFTLGSLHFREGFDGTVAWRTDLSDKAVHLLSGAETTRAREEGWFLCEQWALDDQGGGSVRKRSTSYGEGDSYDVRVLQEVDQYTVTGQPGTYKRLAGRKRATAYESPVLVPGDKPVERMVVDSAWANVPLDTTFFSPPARTERAIAWTGTTSSVRVP